MHLGKMVYEDQYLSMPLSLTTTDLYGLGEFERPTFKHDLSERKVWGMFAADNKVQVCNIQFKFFKHVEK